MDRPLADFLEQLLQSGREHDSRQADRLARWRNLELDSARLLAVLIRALAPSRLLELGTSNGYSTIWLADAARAVGGSLTSVEIDPARSAQARENLRAAGLASTVDLRVADAARVLAESASGEWNFIFLDAERPAYAAYWPELVRALAPRGLLAIDNATSHAHELSDVRALIAADQRVVEALAPTGAGVLLVARAGQGAEADSLAPGEA